MIQARCNALEAVLACRSPPARPRPPALGLRVPPGLGKTHTTLENLAPFVRKHGGPVYIFVPTHDLAEQQAADFERPAAACSLSVVILRGYARPDPDDPGETMCPRIQDIQPLIQQEVQLTAFCENQNGLCPHHPRAGELPACAYRTQLADEPDVFILPHQYLFQPPPGVPAPTLVIIDESFWQSGLFGFDDPFRITTTTLEHSPQGQTLLERLNKRGDDPITNKDAYRSGLSPRDCTEALREEFRTLNEIAVHSDITRPQAVQISQEFDCPGSYRLAMLWTLLRDAREPVEARPVRIELRRDVPLTQGEGVADFVYVYWREFIAPEFRSVPTLILDATLSESLVRLNYPQLELIDLAVDMPHVFIRQIQDKTLSARMMIPSRRCDKRKNSERQRNIERLRHYLIVQTDRLQNRAVEINGERISMLIICQKGLETELVKMGLPDGASTAHFNAIKGLNAFSRVPKIVVAGRILPPPTDVERLASVFCSGKVRCIDGLYPSRTKPIRTRSNVIHLVKADYHPDPIAEEIRCQICEAELLQAIGRARGIRRTADSPLEIDILTNVPLPIQIDEVTTWQEVIPDRFDLLLAQKRVVPLTKGELKRVFPEHFPNEHKARHALRKAEGADGVVDRLWGGKTPIGIYIGNLPPQKIRP